MFDNYVQAKNTKVSKWATVLIVGSVIAHIIALAIFVVHSYWVINKLPIPTTQASFSSSPQPPSLPPAAKKKKKQKKPEKKPEKEFRKAEDVVQPDINKPKVEEKDVAAPEEDDGFEGVGDESGFGEQPVVKEVKPKTVAPSAIKQNRVSGNSQIQPSDADKNQISRDRKSRIITVAKICLNVSGGVSSARVIKSSGYPGYDRKIQSTMRSWRYKPFRVNGKPTPVCSTVTFIYMQSN